MPLTRREFLKGMGAVAGGFGVAAQHPRLLIPYVNEPANLAPGASTWYATSCRECPAGCGMVVRNVQSRVVKCEGNPIHPVNRGRLCARGQAAPMALYDPDRLKGPQRRTGKASFHNVEWEDALMDIGDELRAGAGVAIISDLQTGSLEALMRRWLSAFGSNRLVIYEPLNYTPAKAVFDGVVPSLDLAACDYLVSFGADFLENWVSPVEYARKFVDMRRSANGDRAGFAYIGHRISATAASADIRILVPPGAMVEVARAISSGAPEGARELQRRYGVDPDDIRRVADGLAAAGSPLALPGWYPESAAAVRALGIAGGTGIADGARPHAVTSIASRAEIEALIDDMDAGTIGTLLIYGANPVFQLPNPDRFVDALRRVPLVISLSSFMDETSAHAHWLLPSHTPLESWGDYFPYTDVGNLMQPAMGNLHNTRQTGDILMQLAAAAGQNPTRLFGARSYYEYLRNRWSGGTGTATPAWEGALARGGGWPGQAADASATPNTGYNTLAEAGLGLADPAYPTAPPPSVTIAPSPTALTEPGETAPPEGDEIRLYAFPHIYYYDGRNANRRWLQETPEPVTRAAWGTWAEMHPATAKKLGVKTDSIVEISAGGRTISVGAYVWPGVARNTIAVPIGEGHELYGRFASDTGVNIFPLLDNPTPKARVRSAGRRGWVTRYQGSREQHGREIARTTPLGEPFRREEEVTLPLPEGYDWNDFYPGHDHAAHRWAMVVDLNKCIGCHSCVVACYAENNLGVVGPEGFYRRRVMSWLRIDLYYDWERREAPVLFQPMLCQHCDAAPCEPVCPVYAAAHSEEGINMQVYNRCVGTRYCSNNCPYKVRRFNWFDYDWPPPLNWQLNPDVTVRCRGVMEKCTFCIQRIRQAEIVAKREGRDVRDGEITPACVQTCPAGVFTFGDLMNPDSRVTRIIREDPRAYQVLHELNTKTAVIYLKKVVDRA